MDSSEKYYSYVEMMDQAPAPLKLVAVGSVLSLPLGAFVAGLKDLWMGVTIILLAWNLKGWSFNKMAQETGQICSECGGSAFK